MTKMDLAYGLEEPPVFFRHYWLPADAPKVPLPPNVACLDFSVAKGGDLTAYQWDGDRNLDASKFVGVNCSRLEVIASFPLIFELRDLAPQRPRQALLRKGTVRHHKGTEAGFLFSQRRPDPNQVRSVGSLRPTLPESTHVNSVFYGSIRVQKLKVWATPLSRRTSK